MKKYVLLLGMILLGAWSYAQMPGGMPSGKKMPAPPSIGHIYGKIVDSAGKPVNEASVIVLQNKYDSVAKKRKDVLLKGVTTRSNGEFSLEELPIFGAKLKISAVGFKPMEQAIAFAMPQPAATGGVPDPSKAMASMSAFDKDLGNIKLQAEATQLDAVTVTSSAKPAMKLDIDKKVFNVEKNIVSAGGTALDVMKNVPSVQVDIDGNVTLRNSTPQIYIEGRPTTLTLDQIPADAIESVEVITNPSAKYDASGGGAGILNIILKKNRKTGYNGNLRAGVDKRGGMNGGGDFNVRQGKFNVNASAMVNGNKGRTSGTTDRLNLTTTPETAINQTNADRNSGAFMFGRLGVDYFADNRNSFSLSGIKVHGKFSPTQFLQTTTDSLFSAGTQSSYSERNSSTDRTFNANGVQFGFKHLFPKDGEQLTADGNFFSGKNSNNSLYTTDYYAKGAGSAVMNTLQQQILGNGTNQFLTLQTDYVKPFTAKTKLEAGLRANMQKLTSYNNNYVLDPVTGTYNAVASASTNYKNNNNVYAAYVSVTSGIKNFGYQLGLRAESSDYSGDLLNTGQHFSNKYPVSLFPSVFLSQKLANQQELQLSVTRRVNRPNFFQLIPYTDYTDSLNITRGNPDLVPEFTNSYEFSYMKTYHGNNTFLASVYYKKTTNLITRYLDTSLNALTGKQDLINTYVNANSSQTMGAELTSQNYLTKWWDVTTNVNIYNSKINTDNVTGTSQDALWSWFGKFNSNFKLPADFSIQLTATYQSKTNLPVNNNTGNMGGPPSMQSQSASQGYIKAFGGVDLAIKKSFLKSKAATVTLSVNDIFRTMKSVQYSSSDYFTQTYSRLRDPQMFRINFTYRFGKMDVSLFKRKNMNGDMQGATQGIQP